MHIKNHRLTDHWFVPSKDVGGALKDPRFIVMHYTAGGSGAASRDYMLKSPSEKAQARGVTTKVYGSAHLVVDRDGSIWQIVPFNRKARHAGKSRWKGLSSLNQYSLAIEIANYGWLDLQGDGSYKRSDTPRFAAGDVFLGPMPGSSETKGWENYTEEQLGAVERVTLALLGKYPSIREIVGHQEISPGRKFDPGPAFPMIRFRNLTEQRGGGALDGEGEEPMEPTSMYRATTRLNIRGGPGIRFEKLKESPLASGTELKGIDDAGSWLFVSLAEEDAVRGWVHGDYVEQV